MSLDFMIISLDSRSSVSTRSACHVLVENIQLSTSVGHAAHDNVRSMIFFIYFIIIIFYMHFSSNYQRYYGSSNYQRYYQRYYGSLTYKFKKLNAAKLGMLVALHHIYMVLQLDVVTIFLNDIVTYNKLMCSKTVLKGSRTFISLG